MKKILSLILSFAMLATMLASIPVAQASTIDDVPFIPVDVPFNADVIGKIDETPGANWAYNAYANCQNLGINGAAPIWSSLSNDAIEFNEGGRNGVNSLPTGAAEIPGDMGNISDAKENGYNIYKMKITAASLSAAVDDALALTSTPATLNTSGRVVDKIAVVRMKLKYTSGSDSMTFKITYADETSTTLTQTVYSASAGEDSGSLIPWTTWHGNAGNPFRTGSDNPNGAVIKDATTGKLRAWVNTDLVETNSWPTSRNMKGFNIMYLPVDATKAVSKVEISCTGAGNYIFAATEIPLATADLQAQLTKVSALTTNTVDGDDEADVDLAKRYADELALRGYDVTSEMAHIAELQNALAWYDNESVDVPFIPVDLPLNTDVIGKVGDTAGDSWTYGALTGAKDLGINGDAAIWSTLTDNAIEFNEGGRGGVSNLPEGATAIPGDMGNISTAKENGYNIYKMKITADSLSAGVNDALALTSTPATLNTSGRPVDKVAFVRKKMKAAGGSEIVTFKIYYADGTDSTITQTVYASSVGASSDAVKIPYAGWHGNTGTAFRTGTGDENDNNRAVIKDATTGKIRRWTADDLSTTSDWDNNGSMTGFQIMYLPVDVTKAVSKIEISCNGNGNNIFAATEIPLATADLQAGVAAVDNIEPAQAVAYEDEILLAYRYAKELEARYISKVSTHVQELYDTLMATELGITEVTANKTDDGVEVAVDYTNDTTLATNAVIIVAFYTNDGKVLVDVKSAEKKFAAGTNTVEETFNTDKTWTSAKTFVLTDFDSLIPLTVATPVTQ